MTTKRTTRTTRKTPPTPALDARRLTAGDHSDPHSLLGAHPVDGGVVIRAFHPDAAAIDCILDDEKAAPMGPAAGHEGLYTILLPERSLPITYELRFRTRSGAEWRRADPYRFLPTLGDVDIHLFNEGKHRRLWNCLGSQVRTIDGVSGVAFAVWAPAARRVSVVGDFCGWDGRALPMRHIGASGIFELFVPGLAAGDLYKYEIKTQDGTLRVKTDPFAQSMEAPPATASRIYVANHGWTDDEWMARRAREDVTRSPVCIYEVHVGSWARVPEENNRSLTYREIAPRLVAHAQRFGFTHLELLPIAEHPFTGSWGYQVSGYYAPTARYGTPDDFRYFVDYCHQHGIGVILDWVPAHFPMDDFALRRFDGTALFEHEDPRRGEHPDWGTLIFNYGRHEVRNFLIANAIYWLREFHVDGLRVDAVASMLYLDYSREAGEWVPNRYGGRENLEAIDFLREMTEAVRSDAPGCFTVAEESTAWPGVTRYPSEGGLGFTFKWNMGWMHDTLEYFKKDPVHRRHHHDQLTFAMVYEHTERFVMPLSHDEVVHGKGSMINKMPGDPWQKRANLRLLYTYQYTRPGKQLLFMGSELGQEREWNHDSSIDWHLADTPTGSGLLRFFEALGALYRETPCLWRRDPDPEGFSWIDCNDRDNSVIAYIRRDGTDFVIVVLNLTPVPREDYRIGAPAAGRYVEHFSSDRASFGGSDFETRDALDADAVPFHGYPQSLRLRLPPLGAIVLKLSQ
jgi:1,4-alpha-glucan branching enzyme